MRQLYMRDNVLPQKITLCGSTRFKAEFEQMNAWLTMKGFIVYTVAYFAHADNINLTGDEKRNLDKVHLLKIDNSDAIMVIDVDNYIGSSTQNEIAHAQIKDKKIYYYTQFI